MALDGELGASLQAPGKVQVTLVSVAGVHVERVPRGAQEGDWLHWT